MENKNKKYITASREIAYISVTCALLLAAQFALSFVVGVEIVTLIISSFSFVFGAKRGVILSVAFSFLRCLIFGFYVNALILYLIYYPILSIVFSFLSKINNENVFSAVALITLNFALLTLSALLFAEGIGNFIKISKLLQITVRVLSFILGGISLCLIISYDIVFILFKFKNKKLHTAAKLIIFASSAAVCTVLFTLLDDIITPLYYGYTKEVALAYFYASFSAMLPQTLCATVTTVTLFLPVVSVMERAIKI